MGGLFITMEGTDGAGKTTQIELLSNYLKERGFEVITTREPGGNPISEKIRNIIIDKDNYEMTDMTEALLYAASRAQLVEQIILPALKDGKIVICDRFVDSSLVYQGIARNIGVKTIYSINKNATFGLIPDITFLLRLSPEEGIRRKKKQDELDRIESEKDYFHRMVYKGYKQIAQKNKNRINIIDASKDINSIHDDIKEFVNRFLRDMSI